MFVRRKGKKYEKILKLSKKVVYRKRGDTLKYKLIVRLNYIIKKLLKNLTKQKIIFDLNLRQLTNNATFDPTNSSDYILEFKGFVTASKSLQDYFVYLVGQNSGITTYLEIGAGPPIRGNNSYVLEKFHNWHGVSIELDSELVAEFKNERSNPIINSDALILDYSEIIEKFNLGPKVGYLQIDIDPAFQSLACLLKIPFEKYRFSAVTFEHDSYRSGGKIAKAQRALFEYYGYELLMKDVLADKKNSYEDWWIHPELVDFEIFKYLKSCRVDTFELFKNVKISEK